MNPKTKNIIAGLFFAGLLSGCAAVAPRQLVEARNAYISSSNGLAATMSPAELYDARKELDKANKEFDANGDTAELHDYAYVAHRKIERADVMARTAVDRQSIAEAVRLGVIVRDGQVQSTQKALANSREQLKDERNANNATTTGLLVANAAQGKM